MKRIDIKEVQAILLDLMKEVHCFFEKNELKYYLLGGSALGAVRHNGFIPWDDDIDIGLLRDDYDAFLAISNTFNPQYEVVNFKNAKNCDFGLTRIYIPNTYISNPMIEKTKLDKRLYFDVFPLDNVPDDKKQLHVFEKQILRKKRLLQLIDVHDNGNPKLEMVAKKMVSFVLNPFRNIILSSFDKLLKKYRCEDTAKICSLCSQYSFQKQVMPREVYGEPTLHVFEDVKLYIPENITEYLTTLFGEDYMTLPPQEKRRRGFNIYMTDE